MAVFKITLSHQSGHGGESYIWFDTVSSRYYREEILFTPITSITPPTLAGFKFQGYFSSVSGGTKYITSTGVFMSAWPAPTADQTVYAQWTTDSIRISLDKNGGSGGKATVYYWPSGRKFYSTNLFDDEISRVSTPSRDGFAFIGYWTAPSGGSQIVNSLGNIASGAADVCDGIGSDFTAHAHWSKVRTINVDANGGTPSSLFYTNDSGTKFFSDPGLTTSISALQPVPTRAGHDMVEGNIGGTKVITSTGLIMGALSEVASATTGDLTIVIKWRASAYTLTFDPVEGTVEFRTKSVTFAGPIGTLPAATSPNGELDGWFVNGTRILPTTTYRWTSGMTAFARWNFWWGGVTDFFNLETSDGPLALVSSNSGATRTVIETSHTGALAVKDGDSSVGAFRTFGLLMNPVCTYRIRKEGRVTIGLGAAWAGSGAAKSGYMLVKAEYATAADGEPVLVVRGAANEGAPAINRWSVTLDVSPDHIAQDPMNAVSGGGELTECKTLVTCDPVVPMENGMPCASDIVNGKVIVTATTNAYGRESAPTALSPFFETNGVPPDESDIDFTSYAFQAERSL